MKKLALFLCAFFILGFSALKAQPENGKIMVGLTTYLLGNPASTSGNLFSLGFGTMKQKSDSGEDDSETKITSLSIQPKVGYCFNDRLIAGLETIISTSVYNYEGDYKSTESVFLIGPFVRYYIPAGNYHPFAEGGLGGGIYRDKYSGGYDYNDKYNVMAAELSLGISAPVGDKAAFDLALAYNYVTSKLSNDNPDNSKTTFGSVGINFGFVVLLGGK